MSSLMLYGHNGQLTAIAEIKNKLGTSCKWAAQLRQNMIAHGSHYSADYFLLVTPDRLYLWKNSSGAPPDLIMPTYEVDSQPLFAPYFKSTGVKPNHASVHAFELVVAAWLGDLIRSGKEPGESGGGQSWLMESGFIAAVGDGRIEYEVAV